MKTATRFLRPTLQRAAVVLGNEVDVASLVFARIAFGLIILWEVSRYFDRGWIARYWIDPELNFTYLGFGWVRPWPGDGMYYHFLVLGVLAVMVAIGFAYRPAAVLLFFGFSYVFLLEQARYLNHFYLVILLSFLFTLLPANRSASLDVRLGWVQPSDKVPAWTVWILRMQVGVVYFYGGLAKLNMDWFHGEPMRRWLENRSDFPIIGFIFESEVVVWIFVYGGLLFDLSIVPLLLWKRSRIFALVLTVAFHLTNSIVWSIGIFPWLAIAMTTVFLRPSWPRAVFRLPVYGEDAESKRRRNSGPSRFRSAMLGWVLSVYVAAQLLLPLRHWLYPGPVAWTEEGHRFSWRMKLRSRSGTTDFFVTDNETGTRRRIDPEDHMTGWQRDAMDTHPDMILQFTEVIRREYEEAGRTDVKVTARSMVSLNGRRRQLFFDPGLDLTQASRSLAHKSWIAPLTEPLP